MVRWRQPLPPSPLPQKPTHSGVGGGERGSYPPLPSSLQEQPKQPCKRHFYPTDTHPLTSSSRSSPFPSPPKLFHLKWAGPGLPGLTIARLTAGVKSKAQGYFKPQNRVMVGESLHLEAGPFWACPRLKVKRFLRIRLLGLLHQQCRTAILYQLTESKIAAEVALVSLIRFFSRPCLPKQTKKQTNITKNKTPLCPTRSGRSEIAVPFGRIFELSKWNLPILKDQQEPQETALQE